MANRFFPLTALSIICAASLCSCKREEVGTAKQAAPQAPLAVKTIHPFNGDIMRNVALPGSILPNQQATLYAKISGYLQKITVDKGDVVKEGDLIAAIEAPELIADAAKFKADLDIAEIDFKRTTEAQQKAPDLVVLQSVDAAKAKYLAAKASLQRAETLSSFTKILAPFAGTITKVDWMNPHTYVYVETKDDKGKALVYAVEGGPPNALFRQGWRPDTLKVGDKVSVTGVRAKKAESNRIGQAQITMPDGRVFARGTAANGQGQ